MALTAAMALALAPLAAAEEGEEAVVPPGNSAVNQYTETFPTASGDKDVHKGSQGAQRSPNKVLGSRNAQRLEQQGAEGRAVAEVAAETAPSVDSDPPPATVEEDDSAAAGSGGGGNGGGKARGKPEPASQRSLGAAEVVASPPSGAEQVSGSSGLDEVLAQATGSTSSGEMGLLLPLTIMAALAWSIAFLLRRTRRTAR